ncbi:hypothetical protein [Mycobacteroides abscessus]|uniref:hypothetical protein n=1 Tax=Mycobacteroides abscessus TaxID=36809 RepID=UPI000C267CD3|nr:hypothetical protein [Mycobacteroides abscessus]
MTARPEQAVIDQIDALVDEQMAGGEYAAISRAEAVATGVDRCALCGGNWHGSPWTGVDRDHLGEYDRHNHGRSVGCPGAFATGPQRIRYRWHKRRRSAMRRWTGRGQDPLQRHYRQLQATRDLIDALTEGGPALEQWQRQQRASWFNGTVPNLSPEFQFPRPIRFPPPMSPRGAEATFEALDEAYTIDPAATSAPLPKLFMIPARGGQQSITRLRPDGRALLPLLYGGDRLASAWQPTSWVMLGDGRMNPEQLVRTMREVEHL